MNSFEFIRKFNWIYQPFKMFTNFLKISLIFIIWIFEKIMNEFTNEFIELNLILSFLNFSHFAKLFIKFFKSKSLPWISNCYCHSRNEFTDEFIDLNLIIFCDGRTDPDTFGLLESLDLLDRETEKGTIYLWETL